MNLRMEIPLVQLIEFARQITFNAGAVGIWDIELEAVRVVALIARRALEGIIAWSTVINSGCVVRSISQRELRGRKNIVANADRSVLLIGHIAGGPIDTATKGGCCGQ